MFFTVLWRGVCQVLGWFFGLFGYKRDGRFAKCVWGLFATSAAVFMAVLSFVFVYSAYEFLRDNPRISTWRNRGESYTSYVDAEHGICFYGPAHGKGYVYNSCTGEKLLKNVEWIAQPMGTDSLVCFSNGKKRGYFNKRTGKVVIEPKYDRAWIFSEGLAGVEEKGYIKFIDATGKVVIDNGLIHTFYTSYMSGYVFHGGYCKVSNGKGWGLMDKTGKMVLPQVHKYIIPTDDYALWCVRRGKEMAVLDKDLQPVLPFAEWFIDIAEDAIWVTMPDHTMRRYDLQGNLLNDFCISGVEMLEYETDEILYRTETAAEGGGENAVPVVSDYHPKATARLRVYRVGADCTGLGLMTADGHVVTLPSYKWVRAIGPDLYLCSLDGINGVVLNGKGEVVR
ncbi:hypothetical protein JCM10556A_24510 [Bacteroides acidifaciens]